MNNYRLKKGQSIYEVVIAISIITFALLAMVGLVISSIAATTYTRNKSNANRYTQEAMEWVRTERDRSWSELLDKANLYPSGFCIGTLTWYSGSGNCTVTNTSFRRMIYFRVLNPDEFDVRVETSWQDERGTHASEASTTFVNRDIK